MPVCPKSLRNQALGEIEDFPPDPLCPLAQRLTLGLKGIAQKCSSMEHPA